MPACVGTLLYRDGRGEPGTRGKAAACFNLTGTATSPSPMRESGQEGVLVLGCRGPWSGTKEYLLRIKSPPLITASCLETKRSPSLHKSHHRLIVKV